MHGSARCVLPSDVLTGSDPLLVAYNNPQPHHLPVHIPFFLLVMSFVSITTTSSSQSGRKDTLIIGSVGGASVFISSVTTTRAAPQPQTPRLQAITEAPQACLSDPRVVDVTNEEPSQPHPTVSSSSNSTALAKPSNIRGGILHSGEVDETNILRVGDMTVSHVKTAHPRIDGGRPLDLARLRIGSAVVVESASLRELTTQGDVVFHDSRIITGPSNVKVPSCVRFDAKTGKIESLPFAVVNGVPYVPLTLNYLGWIEGVQLEPGASLPRVVVAQGLFTAKACDGLMGSVTCKGGAKAVVSAAQPRLRHVSVVDNAGFWAKRSELGSEHTPLALDAANNANMIVDAVCLGCQLSLSAKNTSDIDVRDAGEVSASASNDAYICVRSERCNKRESGKGKISWRRRKISA